MARAPETRNAPAGRGVARFERGRRGAALLHHDHLLDDRATVDLEAIEIDPRGHLAVAVLVLPVPVRRVLLAREQYVLKRLPTSDLSSPSLQHRYGNHLREQVVDAEGDPVLP